jgi:hypothetical protein
MVYKLNKRLSIFVSIILTILVFQPEVQARPNEPQHWSGKAKPLPKPSKVKFNTTSCDRLDQSVSRQADAMVSYLGNRTRTNKDTVIKATQELSGLFLYEQKRFPESIRPYMRKVSESAVEELTRISSKGVPTWSYSINDAYLVYLKKVQELGYVGSKCL